MIEVYSDSDNELLLAAEQKFSIGRTENNGLKISHESISRIHAEIIPLGNDWFVKDLRSTNGTFLNGQTLEPGRLYILRDKDNLSIGSYKVSISNDSQTSNQKGLIVFQDGTYEGSFVINSSALFSYGGPQTTITPYSVDIQDLVFVIKEDAGKLLISPKSALSQIIVNGRQINVITELLDRDEIRVGSHSIVISIPPASLKSETSRKRDQDVELPDYLKSRMGAENWNDPLEIKRKNTQSKLDNAMLQNEIEKPLTASAPSELGMSRFTRPSLESIKYQEIEKEQKYALMGVITIVILLGMVSVLFNLYFRVIF